MTPADPAKVRATAALRAAMGASLAGREWRLPDDVPGDDFLAAAARHRAFMLLAVEGIDVPEPVAQRIAEVDANQRLNALRVTGEITRVLRTLDAAGVRAMVFKGPALAVVAYGDFTLRGAGDIDVLVAPAEVDLAWRALVDAGWAPDPEYPVPGPSWAWRHLVRNYYELPLRKASGDMIDLHWHVMPTRSGFPSFDELWATRLTVELAGTAVPTLSRFDSLAHSASHAAKDDWSYLRSLADVHRLASDPELWAGPTRRLTRIQRLSVGLAVRCFGPDDGIPAAVADLRAAERRWSQVEARQTGRSVHDPGQTLPGVGAWQMLRFSLRGSRTPSDVTRSTRNILIPPYVLAGVGSRTLLGALPTVLRRRWVRAKRKYAAWRAARSR